ncbi:hypothetical protein [Microcoleus sp. B13-B6]|uniref:hypothetical protein n=2 Tax=Microcoleus TaxID=44471 RepID=UPI002FD44599
MGEAKRRRERGLGFGFKSQPESLIIGCYLAPAGISDRHTVYLGIRRKNSHGVISKPLSVHTKVTDAFQVLTNCNNVLKKCSFTIKHSDEKIFDSFKEMLLSDYGNQGEVGDRYQVSENIDAFNAWMNQGNYRDKNNPPPGVTITHLTSVVKKRYRVFISPIKEESPKFYGNPEDNSVFHVGESFDRPIAGTQNELFIWQTYVVAAFFADYLNDHDKDSLSAEEAQRLTHEVQDLMNQERSPGVVLERA